MVEERQSKRAKQYETKKERKKERGKIGHQNGLPYLLQIVMNVEKEEISVKLT